MVEKDYSVRCIKDVFSKVLDFHEIGSKPSKIMEKHLTKK